MTPESIKEALITEVFPAFRIVSKLNSTGLGAKNSQNRLAEAIVSKLAELAKKEIKDNEQSGSNSRAGTESDSAVQSSEGSDEGSEGVENHTN